MLTRLEAVSVNSVVDGGGHSDVLDQGVGVILGGHHAPRAVHVIDHAGAVVAGELQDVDQVHPGLLQGSVAAIAPVLLGGIPGLGHPFLGVVVTLTL